MSTENTTIEEMEITNDIDVMDCVEPEVSGDGLFGKLLVGAAIVGGGLAALAYVGRNKIEQMNIKRLEKKGYKVFKDEDILNVVQVDVEEDVEEEPEK